jgi:excisionase family DNA binding protein
MSDKHGGGKVTNELEQVYKVKQVATALGLTDETVYRYLKEGRLCGSKLSDRVWRVKAADVWAFMDGSQVPAKSK